MATAELPKDYLSQIKRNYGARNVAAAQQKQADRTRFNIIYRQLYDDRATFIPTWRDIADFQRPRRPRFWITDVNRGDRRDQQILNSKGLIASRNAVAGLMAGITSPARPWVRLKIPNAKLMEMDSVKEWLFTVTDRMHTIFQMSNLYQVLPMIYDDLLNFGTACMGMEPNWERCVHFTNYPIGSFMLAQDDLYRVRVFMVEKTMTVRQMLLKFGRRDRNGVIWDWSNFSSLVKYYYENNQLDQQIQVVYLIIPNRDWSDNRLESRYKRFRVVWYERGLAPQHATETDDADYFLSDKGMDHFPILAPRWATTGEDTFATECPGMTALGDIKELQILERRTKQAYEKLLNPPLKGPSYLRNQKVSLVPGDITYVDAREGTEGLAPIFQTQFQTEGAEKTIARIESRIDQHYFNDFFLTMLAGQGDSNEETAREIEEKHEEKVWMLMPMLHRFNQDVLDPLVASTYVYMHQQGLIPPIPDVLKDEGVIPEYISILAQAVKMAELAAVQNFTTYILNLGKEKQDAWNSVELHELIRTAGESFGIPPKIVRNKEAVDKIVAQTQATLAQQQKVAMMEQISKAGKNAGQTPTSGDNLAASLQEATQAGNLSQGPQPGPAQPPVI